MSLIKIFIFANKYYGLIPKILLIKVLKQTAIYCFGFTNVNCELRQAAALDGANKIQTFRYIMVPMSWT